MFCPNCGKSNEDGTEFCVSCGGVIVEKNIPGAQPEPQQQFSPPPYQQPSAQTDNTRLYSILAYIGILFIVGLIADPQNQKVKFHVNQGLTLFIAEVVAGIGVTVLSTIVSYVPYVGYILTTLVWLGVYGGLFALAIIGILNASKGEEKQLPVIGKFTLIK
jgi:uncharacterized membrane protein